MDLDITLIEDRSSGVMRLRPVEAHATDGSTAAEMAEGCELFALHEEGRQVGAVAVRIEGDVATITAAASEGVRTYELLQELERRLKARGVRHLGMFTKRPGLLRRLVGQGYDVVQAELIKEL